MEEEFFINKTLSKNNRHNIYRNFLFYQSTLTTVITVALIFNTVMFVELVKTLENLDLDHIVNNSDFNYLSRLAEGVERCVNNETCIKEFVNNLVN